MKEILIYLVLLLNAIGAFGFVLIFRKLSSIKEQSTPDLGVKYFEYLEDNSGKVKNSRRYVIKGQIHYNGLPIGEQFVVSEQIIEEFSWEKFTKLRDEVLLPMAKLGIEAAQMVKGLGGAAKGAVGAITKGLKRKAG